MKEASATDLLRLAWLLLHGDEEAKATDVVRERLRRDPNKYRLGKLLDRLQVRL
jgi:hypothetical protein